MHMTSLLKSSLDGLSGSSGETVAEGARRATGEMVSREAAVARRGRAVQGGRYVRGVPAARAHLLLDDRDLAQAGRRGRSGGAGAKTAGAGAGWVGPTKPKVGARQRSSAPQARARRIDYRCPKKAVRCTGAADGGRHQRGRVMLAVAELASHVGLSSACQAFALNRGFVYRDRNRHNVTASPRASRARPPLALSAAEQDLLLGVLDSERFADVAPAAVYATLLDEGCYHGSIRTMYRLLAARSQTGERRLQRIHPLYAKPELL